MVGVGGWWWAVVGGCCPVCLANTNGGGGGDAGACAGASGGGAAAGVGAGTDAREAHGNETCALYSTCALSGRAALQISVNSVSACEHATTSLSALDFGSRSHFGERLTQRTAGRTDERSVPKKRACACWRMLGDCSKQ